VHSRLRPPPTSAGACLHLQDNDGGRLRVGLPIPAEQFFTLALSQGSATSIEGASPIAAVVGPDGGRLLYADARHNAGVEWQDVIGSFFGHSTPLVKEARRLIEDDIPRDGAFGDRNLVVVEAVGPAE